MVTNGPLRWPDRVKHGIYISSDAQDLISKLLAKDKYDRLGRFNDADDILAHPWFASIDL